MANKHLRLSPHCKRGEPEWWWYEEPKGVVIVLSPQMTGGSAVSVKIPWKSLRGALQRKDRSNGE
jgi:hypothetical protein